MFAIKYQEIDRKVLAVGTFDESIKGVPTRLKRIET